MSRLTPAEKKSAIAIAFMVALRMYGLFLILPVFSVFATDVPGSTPVLIGLAMGVYGLTQAFLQIPMGMLSDVWGRKRVLALGLSLFIGGSVMAAMATDIYWIIAGRAIQGMGAIASTGLALVADVSRPEQRAKLMAIIGSSIGLAFMLAFITGPILATQFGLSGLFWITAILAVGAMVVLFNVVEEPAKLKQKSYPLSDMLQSVKRAELLFIDVGVFMLHASMTALFLVLPLTLTQSFNWNVEQHWQLYLPVMVLSLGIMVPLIMWQEKRQLHQPLMCWALTLLGVSLLLLNGMTTHLWWLAVGLWLYFGLFNYLEASMPSLLSRMVDEKYRGAAMGVFASSEFLGAFVGGLLGGWVMGFGQQWVLVVVAIPLILTGVMGWYVLHRQKLATS